MGRPQAPPLPLSTGLLVLLPLLVLEVVLVTAVLVLVDELVPPSFPESCVDEQAPTENIEALNAPLIASAPHAPNRQAFFADMITPPTQFE
jgi:hypothetical protein